MALRRFGRALLLVSCLGAAACAEDAQGAEGVEIDELPEEVSIEVNAKGATIKARSVSLEIPEGALDKPVVITVKHAEKNAPANTKAISDVYEFGPAGTKFKKDVKVSFATKQADAAGEKTAHVFFTKESDPDTFEMLPSKVVEKEVSAKVRHFSRGFAGYELDADADPDVPEEAGVLDAAVEDDSGVHVPAPAAHQIKVHSLDERGAFVSQTWAAFQDGDGAWQALPETEAGVYKFELASQRYAVAFVCSDGANRSAGRIFYAPSTHTAPTVEVMSYCHKPAEPTYYTLTADVSLASGGMFAWGHKGASNWSPATGTTFSMSNFEQAVPTDVLTSMVLGGVHTSGFFLRGKTLSSHGVQEINLVQDGFTFGTGKVVVQNASPEVSVQAVYHMGSSDERLLGGVSNGASLTVQSPVGEQTRELAYATVPEAVRSATDRHRIWAYGSVPPHFREVVRTSYAGGDLAISMPKEFSATFSAKGGPYVRPVVDFSVYAGATQYSYGFTVATKDTSHIFTVTVERDWLPGVAKSYTLEFPDLSAVPGYQAVWFAPNTPNLALAVFAGATVQTKSADGMERATTEVSGSVTASP